MLDILRCCKNRIFVFVTFVRIVFEINVVWINVMKRNIENMEDAELLNFTTMMCDSRPALF